MEDTRLVSYLGKTTPKISCDFIVNVNKKRFRCGNAAKTYEVNGGLCGAYMDLCAEHLAAVAKNGRLEIKECK